MKKILLVVLILIIALAASPYYFGMKAEKQYHEIIAKIKKSGNVTVKKHQYKKGFFDSKAFTSFEVKNNPKKITIHSTDHIVHGPIDILGIPEGKLNFTPFLAKVDSQTTLKMNLTTDTGEVKTIAINSEGNTDIGFNGTAESQYIIPKYKIIKKSENLVFDWSGLELNFIYDHKTNHLDSSFISRALNITDPETTFTISNITGRSSTSDINQNFQSLTGDFEMKIANINFDSIDTKMNMNNLVFSGFSKTNQGKLQMGMKLTGDKMVANEYEFGPLTYNFAIKDIDATSWIKLQESANSMKSAENPMEQGMQVMGILPELVKYSPVIEIKELSLKSNQGNFDANAKVKIKADNPEMLQNILLIGNTLEAEASVVASKSLVDFYIENTSANNKAQEKSIDNENKNKVSEGAEQLSEGQDFIAGETKEEAKAADNESGIKEFIDSGYFILDGNNYVFKATLKSGLLSINGKPIPLAQMMLQ